jgi:Alginate lyase
MRLKNIVKLSVGVIVLLMSVQNISAQTPRVFVLNSKILSERKAQIFDAKLPNKSFDLAIFKLEKEAKKLLNEFFSSVMDKEIVPPSKDKHDYMSQAPYFWRNPNTPNGLPYIRKDGERNPEIEKITDHKNLNKMEKAVATLSLAYFFTNKEEYAAKATEILRMWFVDSKTKMNPNLEFAQAIPGLNNGRGIGIIETRELTDVIDAVGLVQGSKAWTKTDQTALEKWFDDYLKWLMTSKNGLDEAAAKNNHGTYYDVQVVAFALFVGKKNVAKSILETAKDKRFTKQIEADGRQPLELERTKSWDYSVMNLDAFITLAELGEHAEIDLWNYKNDKEKGNIRRAIDFLTPFLDSKNKWSNQQINTLKPEKLLPLIRRASRKYTDEKFKKTASSIAKPKVDEVDFLLY